MYPRRLPAEAEPCPRLGVVSDVDLPQGFADCKEGGNHQGVAVTLGDQNLIIRAAATDIHTRRLWKRQSCKYTIPDGYGPGSSRDKLVGS